MLCVKNTLLKAAFEASDVDYSGLYDLLHGETTLMLSNTGNAPAKLIKKFRDKTDTLPMLKGAFVEETVYVGEEQLETLANIKSKNGLEKRVLHAKHLDVACEACTTERACLLSIETGGLCKIDAAVVLQLVAYVLETLANIKSKNELIGDVIGLLQSPAKNVISALQSGGNKLHGMCKIDAAVVLQLVAYVCNYNSFIFLFHFRLLLKIIQPLIWSQL